MVESGSTRVLVDCGFPVKEIERRLARLGLGPALVTAVVVTHEHGDHASGAGAFARRHGCPLWTTRGTWRAMNGGWGDAARVSFLEAGVPFCIGDIELQPYAVPHDSCEPVQFVFSNGVRRLGLLTDTGSSTRHIEDSLRGCDGLILECNHDVALLRESAYPASLKDRIGGPFGHLSNDQAAGLLARLGSASLQYVVAAHLSEKNNRPEFARAALSGALGCDPDWIEIADQDDGVEWRELA